VSLSGDKYDPYSIWNSVTEADWFWDFAGGTIGSIFGPDQYGSGPIPMPAPAPHVPVVISEVPQTWEDLERLEPELFEPILETRPGHVADHYPQDVTDEPVSDEDNDMTHTWGHLFRESAGSLIGGWLGTGGGITPSPMGLAPPSTNTEILFPSTPANQAATAAAMTGCDGMAWSGGTPPKGYKVVNHCGVGVLRKVRRRRRRRMLTASDASDLATIVGIVGKGQMAAQMINRR